LNKIGKDAISSTTPPTVPFKLSVKFPSIVSPLDRYD